jgi:hypothetical protein
VGLCQALERAAGQRAGDEDMTHGDDSAA